MMVKIRFTRQGANSVLGGFASGDVAQVSEAFAHHLVTEAMVAEYITPKAVAPAKPRKTSTVKKHGAS